MTKNISTSKIITNIVKDYNMYVCRNLERGVSAEDMNHSFLRMKRIKICKKVGEVIKTVRIPRGVDDIRQEIIVAMRYWERLSNEIVNGFTKKFYSGRVSDGILDRISNFVKLKRKL